MGAEIETLRVVIGKPRKSIVDKPQYISTTHIRISINKTAGFSALKKPKLSTNEFPRKTSIKKWLKKF